MSTQPTPVKGTSIEVLAPYLPYGIEVQVIDGYCEGERHRLRGIDTAYDFAVRLGGHSYLNEFAYHGILPVLRPFSQLCDPLPDGSIPAIEVAKLLVNDPAHAYLYNVVPNKMNTAAFSVHIDRLDAEHGRVLKWRLAFLSDWNWLAFKSYDNNLDHLENISEVINYLRSQQFAVGLQPQQFIPKEA